MKKITIWIIIIFCMQVLTAETITQTYYFEIPEFISNDGYTELIYQNCRNFGEEGYPSLPYLAANILLQQNQEIEKIKIIYSEYYPVQDGITIEPAVRQFPISSGKHLDYKVIPNEKIYNSSESFPKNIIDNTSTHFLCGHSIASFTVCPVSYVPSEKQVEFLKSITVEIKTGITTKALSAERFLQNTIKIEKRIHNIVENPEMLNQYTYSQQSRDGEGDILLITNNTLLPSFTDYIDFKESTGFIVEAVTTEYIDSNYTGSDLQEKIRNCIIGHYTNNGISYVILGGDSDTNYPSDIIVPHRGLSALDDPTIPSDMYYAGLDGNWNNDGDGIWGEQNEWDLYAEVNIGRICVDSATEIQNFTHKLEMYQNSPVITDIEKALMLGEELNSSPQTNGGTYKNEIVNGGNYNGYTTVGISANFAVSTLYQMDFNWDKYDVFDQFNVTGAHLLNHLGHSSPTFNMNMYNSDLTTANFQNDGITRGYAIGYSQGCYNGSFDNWHYNGYYLSEDCFAENITTLETAEVASVANSRYGWYQPGGTNSSSQYYDRQFYDAIFGQNVFCIGDANRHSKEVDVSLIQGDEYMRWTAYELNLFGDPSMDIWTAVPVAMNVSYPASISMGMSSIYFSTDAPFARISLLQNGEIIGRAITGASGDITVNLFTPIDDTNDISVSIIAHNKIRHQGTIVVVSNQAYVIYNSYIINDPSGNNNGEADFGESVTLDMTLENVGDHDALSVNAILSTTDSYITITDNIQSYGTIIQSSTSTQTDAFAFIIDSNIPDQHIISFDLEITGTSSRDTWNSSFQITVNAPELTIDNMIIDDSLENNNSRLDPGETVDLIIPTNNEGHSNSPSAIGTISCASGYITINGSNTYDFGVINSSSTENAVFNITVDSEAPIGTNVSFNYNVTAGSYSANETFNRMIGLVLEDFETGNFVSFPWEFGGSADWSVVTEAPYEGTYCAKSGDISNSQTSELILTVDVITDGTISFYRKVSSESSWDYLKFFIDGSLQEQWSGTVSWSEVSYPVTVGDRTFKWQYYKDGSVSSGSDCAWVDYIIFPALYFPEPVDITVNPGLFSKVLEPNMSTFDNLIIGNIGDELLEYTASIAYVSRDLNERNDNTNEEPVFNFPKTHKEEFRDMSYLYNSRAYCTSTYSNIDDDWITNVTFNTINNDTGQEGAASYGDYTSISTDITQGETYNLSVTFYSEGQWTEYVKVWIDWDKDEDFAELESYELGSGVDATLNMDITVPLSATLGTTRMRVVERYSQYPTPCEISTYGEVEDYTVNILSGSGLNWLTLDGGTSVNGAIPGGSPDNVINVGFDSTDLDDGVYNANITITSNDPDEPTIIIPVTLNVSSQLATPVNVQIQIVSGDVHLSWDEVSGATKYHVFRSAAPYSGFARITPYPSGTATNSYVDTPSNEKYFYRVTAE
jgi:hypothetical protein